MYSDETNVYYSYLRPVYRKETFTGNPQGVRVTQGNVKCDKGSLVYDYLSFATGDRYSFAVQLWTEPSTYKTVQPSYI